MEENSFNETVQNSADTCAFKQKNECISHIESLIAAAKAATMAVDDSECKIKASFLMSNVV